MRCIVIGAGLLGLTTAWFLRRSGVDQIDQGAHRTLIVALRRVYALAEPFAAAGVQHDRFYLCAAEINANAEVGRHALVDQEPAKPLLQAPGPFRQAANQMGSVVLLKVFREDIELHLDTTGIQADFANLRFVQLFNRRAVMNYDHVMIHS